MKNTTRILKWQCKLEKIFGANHLLGGIMKTSYKNIQVFKKKLKWHVLEKN
jgi:hypothetical protein